MQSFYFRPGKNALLAVGSAVLAVLCAWTWWSSGGFLSLGGLLLFGAATVKAGHNALNSDPALRIEADKLTVRTTFGQQVVRWSDVQHITLETLTTRMFGVIPVGRTEILCIAVNGGLTGTRRLRVAAAAIDLPSGGAAGLLHVLQAAQVAAVGVEGAVMAGAGPRGWGVGPAAAAGEEGTSSGFDPDAAIARYLAAKNAKQEAAPAPPNLLLHGVRPRPTFGRRTA